MSLVKRRARTAAPTSILCGRVVIECCPGLYHLIDILVLQHNSAHCVNCGLANTLKRNGSTVDDVFPIVLEVHDGIKNSVILLIYVRSKEFTGPTRFKNRIA